MLLDLSKHNFNFSPPSLPHTLTLRVAGFRQQLRLLVGLPCPGLDEIREASPGDPLRGAEEGAVPTAPGHRGLSERHCVGRAPALRGEQPGRKLQAYRSQAEGLRPVHRRDEITHRRVYKDRGRCSEKQQLHRLARGVRAQMMTDKLSLGLKTETCKGAIYSTDHATNNLLNTPGTLSPRGREVAPRVAD